MPPFILPFFYFVRSFFFLPVPRHLARHCWRLIWVYILLPIVSFSVSLAELQAMLLPISASHPDLQVQFRFLAFFFLLLFFRGTSTAKPAPATSCFLLSLSRSTHSPPSLIIYPILWSSCLPVLDCMSYSLQSFS